jgi:CBS domain-containing protein
MEIIKDFRKIFPPVMDRAYERSKERRHVREIMTHEVTTIEPDASMGEAAKIMGEKRIGSLIVLENEKPVGIVTERDLISKILAKDLFPENVRVKTLMSSPLITISPSDTIKLAAQMMIKEKGRLAVFDEERLVGIVTASDLIKSMPWVEETRLMADDYMTRKVETADEKDTVTIVVKVMGSKRIGSVIITRDGEPYGIFTERDLLTTFLAKGRSLDVPVGEECSSPLYAIPSSTPVNVAAYIMSSRHIKRLPVVSQGNMIGIITARDLVEAYSK